MKHLVLGLGEVGQAYYDIFKSNGLEVFRLDLDPEKSDTKLPKLIDVLHICIRYSEEPKGPSFLDEVRKVMDRFGWPSLVNNMTTCPPGTTEQIGPTACHSTTRGLHPNLKAGILSTPKHIGGPKAAELADAMPCVSPVLHDHAKTTELIHLASNFQYAVNIMAADEIDRWCRALGVDYADFLAYTQTHNIGYRAQGLHSKTRPVVWPSGGKLGGHCVKLAAELIPKHLHGPLTKRLSEYA